ncbi:MAG: hypothetical protein ABI378_15485 [Chitinophagaceae bacterium]
MLRYILRSENRVVFCLCILLIAGMGMSVLFDFNLANSVDQKSYWGMAQLDFHTSPHRKYRFIIPLLAGGINTIIQGIAHLIRPGTLGGDFSLKFSFFLVNLSICALWLTIIYKYCRAYGIRRLGALIGLLAVVTNRWTAQYVGTPHTDLLFCLAVVSMLYGIKTKQNMFLFAAIFLGPFSKESFLFAAPVLFFSFWPYWKTAFWLFVSGCLVFASRYIIDTVTHQGMLQSIAADMSIIAYIPSQLARLKIMGYWIELFAAFGLWWLLPVAEKLLFGKMPRTNAFLKEPYIIAFLVTSLFQIILNGEYARMVYMLMPIYAVVVGMAGERIIQNSKFKMQRVLKGGERD